MMESKCKKCMNGYPSVECVNCGTKFWHYKPYRSPTNADRIRAMSDEVLAITLMCPNEMGMAEIPCDHSDDKSCYECLLKWLQQPAEEAQ